MSHSRKDGRKGGGHRDWLCKEFWSRRCVRVNGDRMNRWGKRLTHRLERRWANIALREEFTEGEAP